MKSKFDPDHHHRHSIRLKGYDYSQGGLYFITICTQHREHLFGTVGQGTMRLNPAGEMIQRHWCSLAERFPTIDLYAAVVMPNHLHGIIGIVDEKENQPTIGDVVCAFKSMTTLEYSRAVMNNQWTPFKKQLWQRGYYDHIIRNNEAFDKIIDYIIHNPQRWDDDVNNV